MTRRLIGIHEGNPTHQTEIWLQKAVDAGKPIPVVKMLNDWGILKRTKEISPSTKTIFRQSIHDGPTPGFGVADQLIQLIRDRCPDDILRNYIDFVEPINEPSPGMDVPVSPLAPNGRTDDPVGMQDTALLMIEIMQKWDVIFPNGPKLLLFAWPYGNPNWNSMQLIVKTGVFEEAKKRGHGMAVHEGVGFNEHIQSGWNEPIIGGPLVPGAGSKCFHYRFWKHLLGPTMPDIYVTEFYPGTLDLELGLQYYVWYCMEANKDMEFQAVLPFEQHATDDWKRSGFDQTDLFDKSLLPWMLTLDGKPPEITPTPDPLPLPAPIPVPAYITNRKVINAFDALFGREQFEGDMRYWTMIKRCNLQYLAENRTAKWVGDIDELPLWGIDRRQLKIILGIK